MYCVYTHVTLIILWLFSVFMQQCIRKESEGSYSRVNCENQHAYTCAYTLICTIVRYSDID